jgi:tetratricopeptide (TPR) repeat protein
MTDIQGPDQQNSAPEDPGMEDYKKGKELLDAGDHSQAAAFFHNALISYEQSGDEKGLANAADQLGDICVLRQDHETALNHFHRSYEICEKLADPFSLLSLRKKMAASLWALKNHEEAAQMYMTVLDTYGTYNNPAGAVATLEELAKLYLDMGERAKATDTYKTVASIHKNFKHERQAQEFLDMASKIEDGTI